MRGSAIWCQAWAGTPSLLLGVTLATGGAPASPSAPGYPRVPCRPLAIGFSSRPRRPAEIGGASGSRQLPRCKGAVCDTPVVALILDQRGLHACVGVEVSGRGSDPGRGEERGVAQGDHHGRSTTAGKSLEHVFEGSIRRANAQAAVPARSSRSGSKGRERHLLSVPADRISALHPTLRSDERCPLR